MIYTKASLGGIQTLKILVINTIHFDLNGMSSVIMNYYKNMSNKRVKFDFIVNKYIDNSYYEDITKRGDHIYILNRNHNPVHYIRFIRSLDYMNKYDIVHIHGNSATMELELFALKNSSSCKIVHSHGVNTQHPMIHKLLYPSFSKSYNIAFAASKSSGEWLFKDKKYEIINNGIDTDKFKYNSNLRKKMRDRYNLNGYFALLHVGSFTEQKNHNFLIELFYLYQKKHVHSKLILIGEGKLKKEILRKAKKLGILSKVLFIGNYNKVIDFYSCSDCLLFPSKFEPFGIVPLEAQCAGLPCIVSNVLPRGINVTGNVKFLQLNINDWLTALEKLSPFSEQKRKGNYCEDVKDNGYDIHDNAAYLNDFFWCIKKNSIHG